jgi:hypothetical protein
MTDDQATNFESPLPPQYDSQPVGDDASPVTLAFRWVMLLGFIEANFFALPGIFWPAAVADVIGARPPANPVWLGFAFLLIFLTSWFFLPAAFNPFRYQPTAVLSVLTRFVWAIAWLFLYRRFEAGPAPWIWILDVVFGVAQALLLRRVLGVSLPAPPRAS